MSSSTTVDGLISGMNTTQVIAQLMQLAAQPQTDLKNQIRGLLKVFGTVLPRGHSQSFEQQVIAASQESAFGWTANKWPRQMRKAAIDSSRFPLEPTP